MINIITKLKIFKDRASGWLSILSYAQIMAIYLITSNFSPLSIIITIGGLITVVVITIFDFKYILPKEQEYYFKVNPEWNKRNDVV